MKQDLSNFDHSIEIQTPKVMFNYNRYILSTPSILPKAPPNSGIFLLHLPTADTTYGHEKKLKTANGTKILGKDIETPSTGKKLTFLQMSGVRPNLHG